MKPWKQLARRRLQRAKSRVLRERIDEVLDRWEGVVPLCSDDRAYNTIQWSSHYRWLATAKESAILDWLKGEDENDALMAEAMATIDYGN